MSRRQKKSMIDRGADLLIRAGAVHTLVPGQQRQQALAVRGDNIVAVAPERNGLDHPRTRTWP